jgi:hypothetical protein
MFQEASGITAVDANFYEIHGDLYHIGGENAGSSECFKSMAMVII